ncbi:hypothetical protein CRUP_029521 [Coryphaenoides rupestris]|nr:hypothetical protein CRUP_029521 [Coryphaenoides rupestris]
MEDSVKAFSVAYNPINGDNTFGAGDYISGNITLELAKECKIRSIHVQLKGKARVRWTEHYGRTVVVYTNKEKRGHAGHGLYSEQLHPDIKPKYCLYLKTSYFASKKRKVTTKDLLKEVGEPIPRSASQHVTRVISIPPTADVSIFNCAILKHEYRLRVYLDVKYASDPEVKFPVVILPAAVSPSGCLEERPPASWGWGFEVTGGNPVPTSASSEPSSYGAHSLYPSLSGN